MAQRSRFRDSVARCFDPRAVSRLAWGYRLAEVAVVFIAILSLCLATEPKRPNEEVALLLDLVGLGFLLLVLDFGLRLWLAPFSAAVQAVADRMEVLRVETEARARWRLRLDWLGTREGVIDLLGLVPFAWALLLLPWQPDGAPLFAMFWILRFMRYTHGFDVVVKVLVREAQPVLGVFLLFFFILMGAASLAFVIEGRIQPAHFGSLPAAVWWSVSTLTTTGYGDAVPATPGGRLLAGLVMICGITLFGMLAGILVSGFAQEVRRRDFLRNWDLVAKVPFLKQIGAGTIADLAALLRPREFAPRSVVTRRGHPGDCMYFIVSGEVEILVEPQPVRLGVGEFFGEIALLNGGLRTATVMTVTETRLLLLDIADFRALAASRPELMQVIQREGNRRLGMFESG